VWNKLNRDKEPQSEFGWSCTKTFFLNSFFICNLYQHIQQDWSENPKIGIHSATECFNTIYEYVGWTWEEEDIVVSRHYSDSWLERVKNQKRKTSCNSQYDIKSVTFHIQIRSEVKVTLELTVSQSVCLGIEYPCGTCDQILFPVGMLLSEICGLVSVGCPLWREDGSAICSVITQWSESLRTRNYILLSHLRLPQPGGPGSHIYIPQEQGGSVTLLGTLFPLCHLLRLAGLRWRYSNPPPPGGTGPCIYSLQE
jgi:hypothetical protein